VIGDADKCPIAAEDFDRFEDDDGCPETDNDGDGIEDGRDACPGEPETRNGLDDDDGCPDTVPPEITKALAAAGGVKFEATRARVTTPAKTALDPLLTLLRERPELRISILVHPDKAGNDDLAKRRGEAVKWYLVDQGLAEDRVETAVGGVVGLPAISITLLPQK
jgi:OOP family OmpA-OmpF porin